MKETCLYVLPCILYGTSLAEKIEM